MPNSTSKIKTFISNLKPNKPTIFILAIALAGMFCLSIIRFVLAFRQADMLKDFDFTQILNAIFTGARFDLVVSFYILLLPILLVSVAQFTKGKLYRILTKTSVVLCAVLYSLLLMCNIGDIPFYEHFGTHLNALVLNYTSNGPLQAIEMILKDNTYLTFAISAIVSATLFCYFTHKMARRYLANGPSTRRTYTIIVTFIFYALTPLWCRGMFFQSKPLNNKDAYISEHKSINEIAKNPEFTIAASIEALDNIIDLIDPEVALDYVHADLNRDEKFSTHHEGNSNAPWKHIIFIVQESSSALRLAYEGNTMGLVPTLDQLLTESIYFDNVYSSNTRTCCGLYSMLTSMPAYASINPMDTNYSPLPTLFNQYRERDNFSTMFFVTHDPYFDNIREFVDMQGFEQIYCSDSYGVPESQLKTWGVDDHVMFDYAIEKIDSEINQGNRVIATCLTCSNHIPYNAPLNVGFTPQNTESEEYIAIQYADWSLNRFIEAAKQKEWFDDALFVITGDHGKGFSNDFYIPDSFVRIPLLFYSPKHISHEIRNDLMSQMDIVPTTFGMAGLEFNNSTFGLDINKRQRDITPYGSLGCVAARNNDWNYIYHIDDDIAYLYDLNAEPDNLYNNVIQEYPEIADSMHHYAACITQAGWAIHTTFGE